MAERVEIPDLTEQRAEQLKSEYAQRGASEIRIEKQPDGRYTLSLLLGDSLLPGDDGYLREDAHHSDLPVEDDGFSGLPGDDDFPTETENEQ